VSFDVHKGEVIGIIGRNGAGKSTLLKILSQITTPTEGEVDIFGRVGSLLEVGTGFHPELTGRENIFLSGAILGMRKREIEEKFDEIIKFSDIEKFIDTPVKRYSSGMYVRLAFAVASHMETEILVVDEVLAVGDARFQKKCLGKMDQVSKSEGRTILFVSHNMSMISSLCDTGILLEKGDIRSQGPVEDVINAYLKPDQIGNGEVIFKHHLLRDKKAVLHAARILNVNGSPTVNVQINEPFFIEMEYELFEEGMRVYPNLHFKDSFGQHVFVTSDSALDYTSSLKTKAKRYISRCKIPGNLLNSGTYHVGVVLTSVYPFNVHFSEQNLLFVTIHDPIEGIPTRPEGYSGSIPGSVRPLLEWELI
jgi:lipopolysaccharide transport system ATP-binding protein